MENGFTNPFAPKFSMTSLEKALKTGTDGAEAADIERLTTQRKRDVIVRGVLSVTVLSAEDLPAMDMMGKADPYVVLHLKKTETKNKTRVPFLLPRNYRLFLIMLPLICFFFFFVILFFSFRTIFSNICPLQVVNDSLNPVWNQTFDFVVEDGLHDMLILEVYDHDTFGKVSLLQK